MIRYVKVRFYRCVYLAELNVREILETGHCLEALNIEFLAHEGDGVLHNFHD